MGKDSFIHLLKTQPFKKGRFIGQGKNPFDSEGICFRQTGFHEFGANPSLPVLFLDS
jgi:hypothetical protein